MCCCIVRKQENLACSIMLSTVLLLNYTGGLGHDERFWVQLLYRQKRSPVQWEDNRVTQCNSEWPCSHVCSCGELSALWKAELPYKDKDGQSSYCNLKLYKAGIHNPPSPLCCFPVVLVSSVVFPPLLNRRCMMQSEELLFVFVFRKKLNTINVLSETLVLGDNHIAFSVLLSFKEVCISPEIQVQGAHLLLY